MKKKGPCIKKSRKGEYGVFGRIWVEGPEGAFLGYGRMLLLERIAQYGSITEAAKSLGMAYRHAWELVDSMNHQSGRPLVQAATGGKGGGGAALTEAGEEALEYFRTLDERFTAFLEAEKGRMPF